MAPLAKFKLRLPKGRFIYSQIWATHEEMCKEVEMPLTTQACCQNWSNPKGRHIATVHLVRGQSGGGMVAHELYHAICHWKRLSKIRSEEAGAEYMGSLTAQHWTQYYAAQERGINV